MDWADIGSVPLHQTIGHPLLLPDAASGCGGRLRTRNSSSTIARRTHWEDPPMDQAAWRRALQAQRVV